MQRIENWLPTDPFAGGVAPVFHAQPQQQHAAKAIDPDEEDDDEGDDDDEDDDDEDAEKDEDELREELKTIRAALKKANGQSAKKRTSTRERIRDLEDRLEKAERAARTAKPKAAPKGGKGDDDVDPEALREEGRAIGEKAGNDRIKRSEAKAALAAAGVPADKLARAARLIDLDDLDVDKKGEVDGLDEAIDSLKEEWPELFPTVKKPRKRVAGEADDGEAEKGKGKKTLTASQQQAKQLLGG